MVAGSKIQITPAELLAQSSEMTALQSEIESLFGNVSSTLLRINDSWSSVLANNFMGKINSAKTATRNIVDLLGQGAEAARMSATTFESVDSVMAKSILGDVTAKANAYTAGGGGYASAGGGEGAFGAESGVNPSSAKTSWQSFWSEQWDEIKDAWNDANYAVNWLKEKYGTVPEEIRSKLESTFPEMSAALKITSDIITNDLDLDTLTTYLKEIGASSSTISAVTETIKVVSDDKSLSSRSYEKMNDYQDLAVDCLCDGDVGGFFINSGKSLAIGFGGGVLGGVADAGTEMISSFVDSVANKALNVADLAGKIIPGHTGEVICNIAESGKTLTDKVTGWISDLL